MKIVIVGTAWPYRGGLANFNERLARELQADSDQVEIETFTLQYPDFLFPGETQYSSDPQPKDLKIERKVNSINPFNWVSVGMELRKKNADIIIIKYWIPLMAPALGTIARIAKGNGNTKIISVLDNVIPHEKRFGDKLLSKYFIGSCDGFIAMSKSVYDDLRIFDKKKPMILSPHPIYDNFGEKVDKETAIERLKLDPQTRYMLFFGLIRDYKGLDILLNAMADSRLRDKNFKLIVAGEFYNDGQKYFDQEKDLQLEGKIIWKTGFVPNDDVKLYFCASDLIVQPYKSATQSGVTQIAYHFERPMLVTNVGGLSEIVPNGKIGYSIEPNSKEITDAICDFYDNNREEQFVANIKEEKKKYSWNRMTENIKKVVREA